MDTEPDPRVPTPEEAPPGMTAAVTVMTVTGPIHAEQLGMTLPHEHVFLNLMREHRATGLLHDPELMARELGRFRDAGGSSLVDCTNMGLGRQPEMLRQIAETTGLNIIMGCGLYREPYLDRSWVDAHSVDAIAECIVRDLTEGVEDTGVCAGIIGEIGCDRPYPSAQEERSFRAAGRAHIQTGATITTHAARWPVGLDQLDLLAEEGVPPEAVIIGHVETVPEFDYHLELLRRGAWVQYDSIRGQSRYDTEIRVRGVVELCRRGFTNQILLSHDVCNKTHLVEFGGTGFAYIPITFVGLLKNAGLNDDEIYQLTVMNPRMALLGVRAG